MLRAEGKEIKTRFIITIIIRVIVTMKYLTHFNKLLCHLTYD
jgi:hypothetical protein